MWALNVTDMVPLRATLDTRGCFGGRRDDQPSRPRREARARSAAVIDTHCHLDHCDPADDELVDRARAAGLVRLATVGTNPASVKRALEAAGTHGDVFAIVGLHPHNTDGFGPADLEEI